MTSVFASVTPSPLPSISLSSGHQLSTSSSVSSSILIPVPVSQVQSMTSRALSTPIKAVPTNKSIQATMPNDTEPTVTTESSSKTPIKLPTTSASSSTRITSHSTTSVSSSRGASATTPTRSPQTSPKPQLTSPIVPPRTTTAISLEGVPSSRSTKTSTITDQPESTFSRIVAISLTNNGTVAISTPAVVTVLSTSTLPDGDFVTYTHVVANPTGFSGGSQALKNTGFLGNHGAMAGVFVVVGIVVAAIGLCFTFFFRRHLRRNRRRRWLEGMHQQDASSHNPFEDPDDAPHMRTFADEPVLVDWNDRGPGGSPGARNSMHSSSSQHHSGVGLVGVGSGMHSTDHQMHSGELWGDTRPHGLSLPFDHNLFHSRASIAQSSPSIYPATLPPDVDDNNTEVAPRQTEKSPSPPPNNPFVAEAPPRPPRSVLRRNSMRAPAEMYPLTPPASVSSHSHSKPPSPIVDQVQSKGPQDVFNRRTLLDLRPRTSPDSVTGEAF